MLEHPLARQSTGTTATPPDLPTDLCKCTATHPAEHAEVWECAHMEIHAQLCPCIYISTPAPTQLYMHTHNAYIYKHAYAHTNTCTHVHMHTYMHTRMHTHTRTCAHTPAPPWAVLLLFTPGSNHGPSMCRQPLLPPSARSLPGSSARKSAFLHPKPLCWVALPTPPMEAGPAARPACARFGVT